MRLFNTGRLFAPDGVGAGGGGDAPGGTPPGDVTAHPVVAPWAATAEGPWKVGEAGKEQEWWNTIPEPEAREHVKVKGYKNPAELALANYSLTKMQRGSSDVISLPPKDADENTLNDFYTKLGRPAKPEDYTIKMPDGVTPDENMLTFGKSMFHKMGATPAQAQRGVDMWNQYVQEQNTKAIEDAQKANAEALTALEATWGAQLNENRAAGERVIRALGLSEAKMEAIEAHIGAAPLVELLAEIGKRSGEGKLLGGAGGGDPNDPANMTKEQAQAKITQLRGDTEFNKAYLDSKHPGHADAVARMAKLYAV